jgi:hypothetical protein
MKAVHIVSGWQQANNWRNAVGAANQQFMAVHDAANAAFAGANTNYWQGMASLAATAALKRVQAQAAAKTAALHNLTAAVGATVNKTA